MTCYLKLYNAIYGNSRVVNNKERECFNNENMLFKKSHVI